MIVDTSFQPAKFINCLATVTLGKEPGAYKVKTVPDVIKVKSRDTVINYQIDSNSSSGIRFTGISVAPSDAGQLSQPSISVDGRLVTFSDINTVEESFSVVLEFEDSDGNKLVHDPQIVNEPQ